MPFYFMKKITRYFLRVVLFLFVLVNIITAFHAYKFTHFYDADEVVVKKSADKTKWDIAKEVFFGINMVKLADKPVADTALHTINFYTNDSIKIEAWYLPVAGIAKGTVLLFHGHGSNKYGVISEAEAFRKMGYHTLLTDFRAHGNSGGNTCTIGYHETEEIKLAYDYIKYKGEKNVILWGISMGAAAITKAMNDYTLQPSKIILEMPYGSIVEAAGGRIKKMGVPKQPLAIFITFWGGVEHGFWAFNMNPATFAKKITVPVLLQWGANDPRVSRAETDRIYTNLSGEKKLVVYENSVHESLCKKENTKWLNEVQDFLSH